MLTHKDELKNLQIVRAIAATSVVYCHIGSSPRFGTFGVDIFFVLSGFVMAMIVANGQTTSTFVISRISRIVPLYWLLTTFLLLIAAIKPEMLAATTANLSIYLKSIFFIPCFRADGGLFPTLAVGWTLNYEMFFYACIALSIFVSRTKYFLLTSALIFVSYFCLGSLIHNKVANVFFGRAIVFEFLLGMIVFRAYQRGYLLRLPKTLFVAIASLAYISMAVAESNHVDSNQVLVYGIPSMLLVFSAVRLEGQFSAAANRLRTRLASIGDASYATYLSHFYVVEGIKKTLFAKAHGLNSHAPWAVLLVMSLALLVGQLVYIYVDKPLSVRLKKTLSPRTAI
jgi:peptidoglycan/LPS O-acetylase OafA/YrhL